MNSSCSEVNMIKKVHQTVSNMMAEARHIIKPLANHPSLCRESTIDKLICLPPVKIGSFLKKNIAVIKDNPKQTSASNNQYTKKTLCNREEYTLFSVKKKQKTHSK